MTLTETFSHHTTQEFPPKKVFFILDNEYRSMDVEQISEFETEYESNEFDIRHSHIAGTDIHFPILQRK